MNEVVIRFAGDSGDGMQLTGSQFTSSSAVFGNDLSTLPDFPAEIRAPAGTIPGVSGYQIKISSRDIHTPGDETDVLVAMNPAALKINLPDVTMGGLIIVNTDSFTPRELQKADYAENPLENHSLDRYELIKVPITALTRKALEKLDLSPRAVDRCKNFFALGMMYYLFERPKEPTLRWIKQKFEKRPDLVEANTLALNGGIAFCEATQVFHERYKIAPAALPSGTYRNISGNMAAALGLLAASKQSGLPLFLGSYPITPASEILHEISRRKNFNAIAFQAEDEIAAVSSALGAAFAGRLAATTTSGPGLDLKSEALGLAVMVELPLLVVDVQRGGPSTGLPTKTEQSDLMAALFGRHGEAPLPIIAASTPGDCFWATLEGARIALKYMTPVIVLTDGYLATGSEPWRVPAVSDLSEIDVAFHSDAEGFTPYSRDADTLARPWAPAGAAGCEHRVGGLEKEDITGNVSYDAANHERMIRLRAEKIARVAGEIPPSSIVGDQEPDLLILGWGSTEGAILDAVEIARGEGMSVGSLHLRYLNPLPPDLGDMLTRAKRVLVPEYNMGQLVRLVRDRYLIDAEGYSSVRGKPIKVQELLKEMRRRLKD